jgi:hypothetical protein
MSPKLKFHRVTLLPMGCHTHTLSKSTCWLQFCALSWTCSFTFAFFLTIYYSVLGLGTVPAESLLLAK